MKYVFALFIGATTVVLGGCATDEHSGMTTNPGGNLVNEFVYWGPGAGQPGPIDKINAAKVGLDPLCPPAPVVQR